MLLCGAARKTVFSFVPNTTHTGKEPRSSRTRYLHLVELQGRSLGEGHLQLSVIVVGLQVWRGAGYRLSIFLPGMKDISMFFFGRSVAESEIEPTLAETLDLLALFCSQNAAAAAADWGLSM